MSAPADEREALRLIVSEARRIQSPEYPNASTDDEVIDAILYRARRSSMIWLAYYSDHSGAAVFGSETAALRYAVANGMQVKSIPFGVDLWEHTDGGR